MTEQAVDTTVCIIEAKKRKLRVRVVDVHTRVISERALVGSVLDVEYSGVLLPNMILKTGILFRMSVPLDKLNEALDTIANGAEPTIVLTPEIIRPMAEPCARVPLSLLRELRGQEPNTERVRRALVKTWSEDRRTGRQTG